MNVKITANFSNQTNHFCNSSFYRRACMQSFFCLKLHANEVCGAMPWKLVFSPRLCVKTAGDYS